MIQKMLIGALLLANISIASAFTTITADNFNQFCPSNTELTFTANNPNLANSAGVITASKNAVVFNSMSHTMQQPWSLLPNGTMLNVLIGGMPSAGFGYVADNGVTTCLYRYAGKVTHRTVYLALRS